MKTRNVLMLSVVLIVLTAFFTSLHYKNSGAKLNLAKAENLIATATQNRVKIISHFPAIGNLEGFVITSSSIGGQEGIVYVNKKYDYMVYGMIIDKNGKSVVAKDSSKYIEPKAAKSAFKDIDKVFAFQQGKATAKHKATIVVDPNCIFCHKLYEALQPKIASGVLSVKWVVVGMIKPSSKAKALAILGSSNPVAALQENEKGFNGKTEEGAITPAKNPSTEAKARLAQNMKFVMENHLAVTPVVLYKENGGTLKMEKGLPQGEALDDMINNMGSAF